MVYLVCDSGGNDSVATKQFMYESGKLFGVVYNDTGWAKDDWPARIKKMSEWCFERGVPFFITKSEGMEALVRRKKGWPMPASNMQWCTEELKEKPTCGLLQKIDPTIVEIEAEPLIKGADRVAITGPADWNLMMKAKSLRNQLAYSVSVELFRCKLPKTFNLEKEWDSLEKTGQTEHKFYVRITATSKIKKYKSIIPVISEGLASKEMVKALHELASQKLYNVTGEIIEGGEITIVTGRRREESQNRANLSVHSDGSLKHGFRDVYNPLAMYDESMRDELIRRAGFEPLPHSSRECWPCTCENKEGLSELSEDVPRIDWIESIEISMGHTKNGKPRTMFRPYRVGGGIGIRQAVQWGCGKRGWKAPYYPEAYKFKGDVTESESDVAYDEDTKEGREFARQCDGGFCGS